MAAVLGEVGVEGALTRGVGPVDRVVDRVGVGSGDGRGAVDAVEGVGGGEGAGGGLVVAGAEVDERVGLELAAVAEQLAGGVLVAAGGLAPFVIGRRPCEVTGVSGGYRRSQSTTDLEQDLRRSHGHMASRPSRIRPEACSGDSTSSKRAPPGGHPIAPSGCSHRDLPRRDTGDAGSASRPCPARNGHGGQSGKAHREVTRDVLGASTAYRGQSPVMEERPCTTQTTPPNREVAAH